MGERIHGTGDGTTPLAVDSRRAYSLASAAPWHSMTSARRRSRPMSGPAAAERSTSSTSPSTGSRASTAPSTPSARCGRMPPAPRRTALDARVAAGEDVGPLAGVPVGVKDVIWEAGVDATAGSRALLGFVPEESATVVDRLAAAGAVMVGRTNIPEFCYRGISSNLVYGTTGNPWDRPPRRAARAAAPARRSRRADAARAGRRRRRLDQDPGLVLRRRRPQAHLRARAARAAVAPGGTRSPMSARSRWRARRCALMLSVMAGPDPLDPTRVPFWASTIAVLMLVVVFPS